MSEYLERQGGFKNIAQPQVKEWQDQITERWKAYLKRTNIGEPPNR